MAGRKRKSTAKIPPAKRLRMVQPGDAPTLPVILDDNITDDRPGSNDQQESFSFQGPFRFSDLPSELRVRIYEYLLPNKCDIGFLKKFEMSRRTCPCLHHDIFAGWSARARPRSEDWPGWSGSTNDVHNRPRDFQNIRHPHAPPLVKEVKVSHITQSSLFLVNKEISQEAKAVVYNDNTFHFHINSSAHSPISLHSVEIFGGLGVSDRLPVLRNLRVIHIALEASSNTYWDNERHKGRLEYFINTLKEHSDDANRKSLLKSLKVDFRAKVKCGPNFGSQATQADMAKCMFSLEKLAALRGIEKVQIRSKLLPEWYIQCLELCMQGEGGDVLPLDYPEIEVKKRATSGCKKYKNVWQTTKKWYQPSLNWEEFAERNGVEIPPEADLMGTRWHPAQCSQ